jgi:hypothetical protein
MSAEMMRMLTTSGVEVIPVVAGSDAAHTIGQHWNAVKQFLHTGDTSVLEPFDGKHLGLQVRGRSRLDRAVGRSR